MPWNFLSELVSRKSPQESNVEKPAKNIISLKIRVAESEEVERSKEPVADAGSADHAFSPITVPLSGVYDSICAGVIGSSSSVPRTKDVGMTDSFPIEADAPIDVPLAAKSSAQSMDERLDGTVSGAGRVAQGDEGDLVADRLVLSPAPAYEAPVRTVKQPIINLHQTRARPSYENMAELDVEIAELRQALSSRLTVQNEQLRQMLQRFPG